MSLAEPTEARRREKTNRRNGEWEKQGRGTTTEDRGRMTEGRGRWGNELKLYGI
jgi:hypothetical protein